MRIDAHGPAYVVDIKRPEAVAPAVDPKGAAAASGVTPPRSRIATVDRVEISPRSRELDRLKQALDQLPEVRQDKVALARQQMQQGSYRVDPGLVAKSLMDSLK